MEWNPHRRADMRLYLQAVKNGWPVPADQHDKAQQLAASVLADSGATDRERIVARLVLKVREREASSGAAADSQSGAGGLERPRSRAG